MDNRTKEYKAMIWDEAKGINGKRVKVSASGLKEARELFEEKHGKGNVFDLHNEQDANKPR